MKKNFLWALLLLMLLCSNTVYAVPVDMQLRWLAHPVGRHTMSDSYMMRYADTKEILPLSLCDSNGVYGYAPKDRPVEIFESGYRRHQDLSFRWYAYDFLVPRGVIKEDEFSRFQAEHPISRKDVAVWFARLLSARDSAAPPFADVAADAPYASELSGLYQIGVITGDGQFYPDRSITRQEFFAMLYRSLEYIKAIDVNQLTDEKKMREKFTDYRSLSGEMKRIYRVLNAQDYWVTSDVEYKSVKTPSDPWKNPDQPNEFAYYHLNQETLVTRAQAAEWLHRNLEHMFRTQYPARPREPAKRYGLDQKMPILDGSTSSYPLTANLYRHLFTSSPNHPQFIKKHSTTITAYERLLAGDVELILVPDPSNEIKALAKTSGIALEYIPIGQEAMVFFTGKDNPISGLDKVKIGEIYRDNSVTNWKQLGGPDAPFAAFCRNRDSGSHALMERFFLGSQPIHADIRRERTSIAMINILKDVETYERMYPDSFALGYSLYFYFYRSGMVVGNSNLRVLPVEGVMPSVETMADGSYPLSTHYFAVLRADAPEDSPARKMAAFLTSKEGQECVFTAGYGPLSPETAKQWKLLPQGQ